MILKIQVMKMMMKIKLTVMKNVKANGAIAVKIIINRALAGTILNKTAFMEIRT